MVDLVAILVIQVQEGMVPIAVVLAVLLFQLLQQQEILDRLREVAVVVPE